MRVQVEHLKVRVDLATDFDNAARVLRHAAEVGAHVDVVRDPQTENWFTMTVEVGGLAWGNDAARLLLTLLALAESSDEQAEHVVQAEATKALEESAAARNPPGGE